MSANVPAARKELAQSAYSRWMGEGGANVTIGDHGAEEDTAAVAAADPDAPPIVTGQARRLGHHAARRRGGHRRHHQLHQHLEPVGHDRRGPGGQEGGRARPHDQALGQDQPGAGLAGGHRLPRGLRAAALPGAAPFNTVGYGCTTCIGNSGPLPEVIAGLIDEHSLVTAAVLSGNRNFEARVHPQVRANYLASPMLVVAFALAGRVDIDLSREPLGTGKDGRPVFLQGHLAHAGRGPRRHGRLAQAGAVRAALRLGVRGRRDLAGAARCPRAAATPGTRHRPTCRSRRSSSTSRPEPPPLRDISGARVLAVLGDSVTTDHISPGGLDPQERAGGPLPAGARGRAGGLEHVRLPARQPRSHDARHLRQRAHRQRAGARQGGELDPPFPHRRGDLDLRRGDAVPGRRARRW